jgi:His Kinase A (phospho-acceptor) domain
MLEGCFQKLSDIFPRADNLDSDSFTPNAFYPNLAEWLRRSQVKAEGEWFAAIAALENILLQNENNYPASRGLILSGPTALVRETKALNGFEFGVFTVKALKQLKWLGFQLPSQEQSHQEVSTTHIHELPLLPTDPITNERFCLVFTEKFSLLLVLGEDQWGLSSFQFSFDPVITQQAWQLLRQRLVNLRYPQIGILETIIEANGSPQPDYRLVSEFSRQLLQNLPDQPNLDLKKPKSPINAEVIPPEDDHNNVESGYDLELLRAFTHEIRTPLTTIRTITRLLLKRAKVTEDIQKYLETIDLECSEQIQRMELIFRAVELGINPLGDKPIQLIPICLEKVFQDSIPRWQKQAKRRNVTLEVDLPKKLPSVISDPNLLDQMLNGVMEKCTRTVASGGLVRVQISTAGSQLKLQFHSQLKLPNYGLKALGQVLMFQPETGNLSLNMNVTKNLFQALGGKFIVRQKPEEGEILTIFLPLGRSK